jgi:hypothetical protein
MAKPLPLDVRRIVESLVAEAVRKAKAIFHPPSDSSVVVQLPPDSSAVVQQPPIAQANSPSREKSEQCLCSPCRDIISRAHSAQDAEFRRHDHNFVQHWLTDPLDSEQPTYTPWREIRLDGFSDMYLENLEREWLKDEQRLDHRR